VSEELLRRINVDYVDMDRRLSVLEAAAADEREREKPGVLRLKGLLRWRQQENETLLQRLAEAPMHIVTAGHAQPNMRPIGGQSVPVGRAAALQQHGRVGAVRPTNEAQAMTQVDPLVVLYQSRLMDLEAEVSDLIDVDIKASVDEYYVHELAVAEAELVEWMTRCRTAEEQRLIFETALRARNPGA
jgi:hypothetical protein